MGFMAALEMGPAAAHFLIIHSVKEMGETSNKKGFRGYIAKRKGCKDEKGNIS